MITLLALLSTASAVDLHHCTGLVRAPGLELEVSGYGSSPEAAAQRALLSARQVGAHVLTGQVFSRLLGSEAPATAELLGGAEVDPQTGLPLSTYEARSCTVDKLSKEKAYRATIRRHAVDRQDPGLAASAARRQACELAWATPLQLAFEDLAVVEASARGPILDKGVRQATEALTACHQEVPTFEAATAPPDPPQDGVVECLSYTSDLHKGPTGRGWGTTVGLAADNAAWDRAINTSTGSLGYAFEAVAHASPEIKTTMMAAAMVRSLSPVPGDAAERGLTGCTLHPATGSVAWAPASRDDIDCADKEDWAGFVGTDPAKAEAHRHRACASHAAKGARLGNEAIAHASDSTKDVLRAAAWSIVLGCDARCRGQTALSAPGKVAQIPGVPTFDEGQAAAVLTKAAQDKDLGAATTVLPALASDNLMRRRLEDPEAFWTMVSGLAAQVTAGTLPPGARWGTLGTHAILVIER